MKMDENIETDRETIETDEEWQFLRGLQIDGVQGYSVGMPAEI